jgi:hypothetical protein
LVSLVERTKQSGSPVNWTIITVVAARLISHDLCFLIVCVAVELAISDTCVSTIVMKTGQGSFGVPPPKKRITKGK